MLSTSAGLSHVARAQRERGAQQTLWTMAFTPILMPSLAHATDKTGVAYFKYVLEII